MLRPVQTRWLSTLGMFTGLMDSGALVPVISSRFTGDVFVEEHGALKQLEVLEILLSQMTFIRPSSDSWCTPSWVGCASYSTSVRTKRLSGTVVVAVHIGSSSSVMESFRPVSHNSIP